MGIGCRGFEGPGEQKKGGQVTHNEARESTAVPELEKLRGRSVYPECRTKVSEAPLLKVSGNL